jgi:hypothetical protein
MKELSKNKNRRRAQLTGIVVISLSALLGGAVASAQNPSVPGGAHFSPGNLVVTRSVYDNNPNNVQVGAILPPNCASTQGGCSASSGAPYDGTYPFVWNDALYDGSFGITSTIFLDQITPFGQLINSVEVPNSSEHQISSKSDQLVTSFSSKSELALHLSADGQYLSFVGYVAPIDALDVSNANTPGAVDPTNPVGENYYRAAALVDKNGNFHFTETNAYSGDNGRAALLNNIGGSNFFYSAGNAGNGSSPQPDGIILGAGAQILAPSNQPESAQNPGTPTPVASFSITELGSAADKIGKDDNFRGITIFDHVLYYTKGSGSNGVNTVYFVDTTGTACPHGVGLPSSTATLPTSPLSYNLADLQTDGFPVICASWLDFPRRRIRPRPPSVIPSACGSPTPTLFTLLMKVMAIPVEPTSTRTPPRKPQPDCRSGCSIPQRACGIGYTRCKQVSIWACPTTSLVTLREPILVLISPGPRPRTDYAISPAMLTGMAPSPFGPSPRPPAEMVTPARTRINSWLSRTP